ncbi:Crp/Fnr family transcriptional regulator [Paucibacter sp. KBW04]|nr:Crp/Fnr family transcriptional regulator [Paucibacter sp. KBW04]
MSFTKDKSGEGGAPSGAALHLFQALAGQALDARELRILPLKLAAGEVVFEPEQIHPYVYVVRSGLLKLHYRQANGEEWIKSFSHEGLFFGSLAALQPQGRSSFAVTALEDCELERLDYRELEALAERDAGWMKALYRAMRLFAARKEQRERELLTLSPPERYQAFLREDAALAARLPLKELALYLGITPVSLSRIRARLSES